MWNIYIIPSDIPMEILLPSLRDVAIVEQWKLCIKSALELFGEYIDAGVLHEGVIWQCFLYLEFAMQLFRDLDGAGYAVLGVVYGDIVPER